MEKCVLRLYMVCLHCIFTWQHCIASLHGSIALRLYMASRHSTILTSAAQPRSGAMTDRRFLVVLDLNGTILQRLKADAAFALLQRINPAIQMEAKIHGRPVIARPGAKHFLTTLLTVADVAVWTSAQPKNAVPMVMLAFGGLLSKDYYEALPEEYNASYRNFAARKDFPQAFGRHPLSFLWTQNECQITGSSKTALVGDRKPEFCKDLRKIFQAFPGRYTERNTIMIDDSPKKIPKTLRRNLLQISEYDLEADPMASVTDQALDFLGEYLEAAFAAAPSDIRDHMRTHPFTMQLL